MKRLIMAAALILVTSNLSVWAQTPTPDANKAGRDNSMQMPMADCAGGNAAMQAVQGCPMAKGEKSEQGGMPMHQMKHGDMMHGAQHPGGHSGTNCCTLSEADKAKLNK